ncbi:MAG: DinB family protein [Candidatus Limnocylindria bacterium]
MSASTDALLERLAAAERRLVEHAAGDDRGLPPGLTEPDPGASERWEAGQVWAHVAEFPGYWLDQVRSVLAHESKELPHPFGRTKTDPGRLAAIEREQHTDPRALLARVRDSLAEVTDTVRSLPDAAWTVRGLHATRGDMSVADILERFVVSHLEEHADQLDGLRRAAFGGSG